MKNRQTMYLVTAAEGNPKHSRTWRVFQARPDADACRRALERANGTDLRVAEF